MYEERKLNILTEIFGSYSHVGSENLFFCPKCKHHKKKLSVNIDKDKFKCWICDWSGSTLFRLVKRYGSYKNIREWAEMIGSTDITDYEKIFFDEGNNKEEEAEVQLPKEFISLCNKEGSLASIAARRYLRERGISREDILQWKIGYCIDGEYSNRVVFPSFTNEGKVNYFVARCFDNSFRKYMNPNASKDIIFNELYIDWNDDVVIVEGVFDAIKATNAIPILGSTLRENSKLFQKIVKNDPAIYIALDPDAEKKAEHLISNLLQYNVEVYKIPIPSDKDVGDMTKEEFKELKKLSTSIFNTAYMLYNKIMSI